MKTKLIVEIETPDFIEIFPEGGQSDEDWKGKKDELKKHREEYAKDLHKEVVKKAKGYFDDELFEENLIDSLEELYIEGYESFDDYKIKINTEVKTSPEKSG